MSRVFRPMIVLLAIASIHLPAASSWWSGRLLYAFRLGHLPQAQVAEVTADRMPVSAPDQVRAIDAYWLTYLSTAPDGSLIPAAGLALVPAGRAETVVSLQHGTFFADTDAPSLNMARYLVGCGELELNTAMAVVLAGQGQVVFAGDAVGYVLNGALLHPYLLRESADTIYGDMLSAGRQFLRRRRVQVDNDLVLAGYSEGGHNAVSLSVGADLSAWNLVGIAAGAGPHDVLTTGVGAIAVDAPGANHFFALLAASFKTYNDPARPYAAIFQEQYLNEIPAILGGRADNAEVLAALGGPSASLQELFTPAFVAGAVGGTDLAFLGALQSYSTLDVAPPAPVLLFHSAIDQTVPAFNSLLAYQSYAATGASVQLAPLGPDGSLLPVGGHVDAPTIDAWLASLLNFIEQVDTPALVDG